jgi:ATP phosphoribosyltransferase regulatory subunit HisZ
VTRIPTPRPGPVLQRLAQARIQLRAALADIPAMGLEAVIKKAPANSTVAAALADLPAEAGPAQAEDAVKHMLETIREMAEGLYA